MVEVAQSVAVGACTGGCSHGNRQDIERGHVGNTNGYTVQGLTLVTNFHQPGTHFLKAPQPSKSATLHFVV